MPFPRFPQVVQHMKILSLLRSVFPVVMAAAAMAPLAGCGSDDENAPKIPHEITSSENAYCLGCHKDGTNGAPKTPHPDRSGCTGCHTR